MPVDVLIVDDSAAIRKILQRVLTQTNLPLGKVLEAADGHEALEAMKQQKVGLIFSDINMPKMDGLQLLSELQANAQWKDVPVLMISTEGSQAKVMEAVQLGARGFVRKPFTADQIKEKLAGMLSRARPPGKKCQNGSIKPRLWPTCGAPPKIVGARGVGAPPVTPPDSVWYGAGQPAQDRV